MDGMKRAIDKIDSDGLCCACFSAKYPDNADSVIKAEPESIIE